MMASAPGQSRLARPDSAGHVKKPDLLCMRPVERMDRLGGGLQLYLAALLREIRLSFRRQMHIAHLARAENELLASLLEDELRFVLREDMRGAVVLLRQLLLPLHYLAGKADCLSSKSEGVAGAAPVFASAASAIFS